MSKICHAHCPGGGSGSAVLVVVAVVVIAAVARPVVHAAEVVAEVVLIAVASIGGLVLAAAVAWAALRVHRWRANRAGAMSSCRLAPGRVHSLSAPQHAAIEAPRTVTVDLTAGGDERYTAHNRPASH